MKKSLSILEDEPDPAKRRRYFRAQSERPDLLEGLERRILEYSLTLRSLKDQDILEALKVVEETYQTETRGLIFEHSSTNPLAQALAREVRGFFEKLRQAEHDDQTPPPPRAGEVLDSLCAAQLETVHHIEHLESPQAYQEFIRRKHPDVGRNSEGTGGIILA